MFWLSPFWQMGKEFIANSVKKSFIIIFVRLLKAIGFLARGAAVVFGRLIVPLAKKADKAVFYYILFPIYKLLRAIFHTAELAALPARRKILYMLAGRQAIPFFLLITAMLVAASNLYAKVLTPESEPGEHAVMVSVFSNENYEFIYETGTAQDSLLDATNSGATALTGELDQLPADEDDLLPLIVGEGAVAQPIISSSAPSAAPRTKIETYIVKEGDTAGGIAKRFGLNLTTLYWANNLTSRSYIRPGQELKIPPVDGIIYTAKKGDTVAGIAKTYGTKSDAILSYNRLGPNDKLSPGSVIIIPNGRPPAPPPAPPRTVIAPKVPSPDSLPGGRFLWPVVATASNNGRYLTQYFNWRHTGVDIDGDYSNPVVASEAGVIKIRQSGRTGYGNQIVIDHENGILTRYAHLSKFSVEAGQRVERGQVIGIVGSTGRSTGTHLHYEIFVNGRRINPLTYIR